MRYLKSFNEELTERLITTEMVGELRDFCRDHLAYLIDEMFTVQVTPTFNGTECDIIFYKTDIFHSSYRWVMIKDHFIPFLYMLNKHYNIIDSNQLPLMNNLSIQSDMINDIVSDNGSFRDDKTVSKIKIRVDFKDQSITESVDFLENIKDFCKNYLANLLDDTDYGFNIRKVSELSGRYNTTSVIFLLFNHDYWVIKWDNIKDHVIPFLHMLIREYKIEPLPYYYNSYVTTTDSEDPRNRILTKYRYIDDNPRNRTIRFRTGTDQYYYTSIENVINDEDVPQEFYQIQIQFY